MNSVEKLVHVFGEKEKLSSTERGEVIRMIKGLYESVLRHGEAVIRMKESQDLFMELYEMEGATKVKKWYEKVSADEPNKVLHEDLRPELEA